RYRASHGRKGRLYDGAMVVSDEVDGFQHKGVQGRGLGPGQWIIEGKTLDYGQRVIQVNASVPIVRFDLVGGWESRYYLEKKQVPVLEIEINQPGSLITEYRWAS